MAAELSRKEADSRGVRRLLCEQIDSAADLLQRPRISDGDIHSARKSLKKARAILRLLRSGLAKKTYERENITLRDAARPLSNARDATVLLESLDRLEKLYGDRARKSIPAPFRRLLKREQTTSRRALRRGKSAHVGPLRSLRASKKRLGAARVHANGWMELGNGLERVYHAARKAMERARKTPSPECLHEWRKQSKHLWHQLQLLEPMEPHVISTLAAQAHKLSDDLGEDHDHAVLRDKVVANPRAFPPAGDATALLALIGRRQKRLRARAFLTGKRIYVRSPSAFVAHFERYWRRWQKDGRQS